MLSLVIIIPTHQRQNKNKTWHLKNLVTVVNIYIIICYMNIGEVGVARCRFNKWAVNGYRNCLFPCLTPVRNVHCLLVAGKVEACRPEVSSHSTNSHDGELEGM